MLTIGETVRHAQERFAERTCTVCGTHAYTYAEFANRSSRLGAVLASFNLQPGDRVAVLAANCHRYLEAFAGIPASGLVIVPLNTRLAEAELLAIIEDCSPKILITDRDPGSLSTQFEQVISWPDNYETLLESVKPEPFPYEVDPSASVDRLAALFYTGGTTGRPKGVMLTHRNLVANSFHKTIAVGLRSDDVFLAAPAMFHVAGIAPLLSLLTLGARMVFVAGFDPVGSLDAIEAHGATMMFPVPTMLAAMVGEQLRRPRNLASLRMLGHAGSSISVAAINAAVDAFPGVELAQFYGATETASIVTCQRNEQDPTVTAMGGTVGQPVAGVSVRIVDPSGLDVPIKTPGEVVVRGNNVMVGYWGNPEATAAALKDGWYRTGDIGVFSETHHLFIVDRAKDMIVSGGENVYSIEVENALYAQDGVLEAAVFGIPHATWGEAVHAVVVVEPEVDGSVPPGTAERLQAGCRSTIAGYKIPKTFDINTTPLPKSGPGKILKRVLRDAYLTASPAAPAPTEAEAATS